MAWPVFRRRRSVFALPFSCILSREPVGILPAVTEVHLTTLARAKATESLPDWLYFGGWRFSFCVCLTSMIRDLIAGFCHLCVRRDRASCRRQIRRVPNTNLVQYHFARLVSNISFVSPGRGQKVCFHWKAGSVPSPSFRRWHISEEKSLMSIRVCQPQQFSNRRV